MTRTLRSTLEVSSFLILLSMLVACGSDDTSGSSSGRDTLGSGDVTTSSSSGGDVTTSSSSSSSSSGDVTTSSSSSGDVTTSSGADTTSSSSGGGADTATSSGMDTSRGDDMDAASDVGEDIPSPPRGACAEASDCALVNDCCDCTAQVASDPSPRCDDQTCFVPMCTSYGLDNIDVRCRFGECRLTTVSCNQNLVSCDGPTPDCSPGTLPSVEAGCWTGRCVPVEACDFVPDCSHCAAGETCVRHEQQIGLAYACEPIPAACERQAACDCMPDLCPGSGWTCTEGGDGQLSCVCLACSAPGP